MGTFNRYLEDNTIEFYTYILYIGTYVVIIITILTMIMTLLNAEPTVRIANGSVCFSAVLIVTSLLFVYEINSYVDEATYGGIDELLRLTAGPFLLLLFSILQKSCLLITEQQLFSNITSYRHINLVQKQCPSCGAFIQNGAIFCDKCGARTETETPKPAIIYCTNCGQPIPYGTAFCTNCGQNVNNTI